MKKIIFFGTSDFGIESMNEIIKKYNLISVVTNPDKKIGRGMKITKTKIKIIAEKHNIKVYVDPFSEFYLLGTKIDYIQENLEKNIFENKFTFTPDKKKASTCGCGVSFSPKM